MALKNRRKHPRKKLASATFGNDIKLKKTTLPNGIRIITEEVPSVSSFALGITINAGSRDDPEGLFGIAHFLEHACYRHTKKRTSRQIASLFEQLGAYTNAFTTKELTCFYVRALSHSFRKSLDLMTDVALFPLFIEEEINKERAIILDEIKSYYDDPEEYIYDLGEKELFSNSGLAHPITGLEKDIENITPAELFNFHKENYTPENIIFSIAGSIDHEYAVENISRMIENYELSKSNRVRVSPNITLAKRGTLDSSYQQSHLLLYRDTESVLSEDRYPLAALNVLLGDGMSSRLYRQIRENHGLAYNIYSSVQLMSDIGAMFIYTGAEDRNIGKIERLIYKEMNKIIEKRIPKVELLRIKEQLKSSTIMSLESMTNRMQALAKSEISFGYNESIEETISKIEKITIEDIKSIAEKYLKKDEWSMLFLFS